MIVISSTVWPVPLKGYGGLEQIAYWTAEGLANLGHDVTLVAPNGSTVPGNVKLFDSFPPSIPEQEAYKLYKSILTDDAVIISHSWYKWEYMAKAENPKLNVIGVCHAPIETMYQTPPPVEKPCFVGLSKDQTTRIKNHLKIDAKEVYNGIDTSFYVQTNEPRNDRYLFMGRMSTIKGPHVAIELAKAADVPLDIVGDDAFTMEPQYAAQIKQSCQGKIEYRGKPGGVTREETVKLYNSHKALLNTIQWDAEPFGLIMVEAMACGMPVLVFDKGSPKEIVVHGETGFVAKTNEEMLDLIKTNAVSSISPEKCRKRAERFSKENMAKRYEELCSEIMQGKSW